MNRLSHVRQRRFKGRHQEGKRKVHLSPQHPAVIRGRTLFPSTVIHPDQTKYKPLKSGQNSRKIGRQITKGHWKGMPVYTLTMEERKTCPRSCVVWQECFGNKMQFAQRFEHGLPLENALEKQLAELQDRHPRGFAIRLHVLGDFYSLDYLMKWISWFMYFPALHVFGFTAHGINTPIGTIIYLMQQNDWDRFAIRFSDHAGECGAIVVDHPEEAGEAILCPAQVDEDRCCANCGLCWNSKKPIAFRKH